MVPSSSNPFSLEETPASGTEAPLHFLEKALGGFLNPRDVAFAEHGKGQWKTLHRHP